jgi:hypothetical protein
MKIMCGESFFDGASIDYYKIIKKNVNPNSLHFCFSPIHQTLNFPEKENPDKFYYFHC